jgi:RecA/RadA recombinase
MGRDAELAWCTDAFSRRRVVAICGLPGIGKTSLLLTAAHDQAQRVAGTVAYHAAAEGEGIGDVLASLLGAQPGAAAGSLRAALDQVVARSQRAPAVLCIDDVHRISDPMLLDVLAHLGASSSSLWIAVASRRQLPLPDTDIDGAVLRLGPLSTQSARALWADLEERFGPSVIRFDALDPARRASPFALRRAFATGRTDDGDGVGLTGLAPAQAALLAQICAFDGPVDVDRLAAVTPDDIAALPALLQALLVELTASRTLTVHDLVRASVARSARPPGVAEHVVCLRFYGAGGNDLARLRHTIGARQWAAAIALIDGIVKPHYGFFPMGAAAETQVLAALSALHDARIELPLPLRLARLQLAARHGQGRAVLDALRDEAASEPAAWPHLGTVELLLGDAPAAEAHLRQALADRTTATGPIVRAFLLAILLEVLPWIAPGEPRSGLGQAELALAQLERALAAGDLEQARRWTAQAAPVRTSRWRYLRARLAVLDAELAVRRADAPAAGRALGEAEAVCAERGYRREHAVAALVAVALAQLMGDPGQTAHWTAAAASRAAGIAADLAAAAARLSGAAAGPLADPRADRWLDRLELRAPRPFRWREPAAVRSLTQRQADAARFAAGSFGIDARDRTVHVGGAVHSFARRTGLWSVLSALLTEPGQVVSPDQLARRAWGVGYHAVRHHSRLVVSIKRLRDALGGDAIASLDGGYRLAVEDWAVLEPAPGAGDPTRTGRGDATTSPW